MRIAAACLLLGLWVPAQRPSPQNPYGFPDWRADLPVQVDLPQRTTARAYDRSRRQAVEQVVANLQGNTRREVWQMATEFFGRAPEGTVEALIEAMDRAYANPALSDIAKNVVDAMGLVADERFDEALRRALEHPSVAVKQAAYAALGRSGKAETVLQAYRWFLHMDGKARASWLAAARNRLGPRAVPLFRDLMTTQPILVRDQVLKEVLQMPADQAADVLRPLWPEAVGEFKVIVAGALHGVGEASGTVYLRDLLRGDDPGACVLALRNLGRHDLDVLREDVLRLSLHGRTAVRQEVVNVLVQLDGDDVADTLEVLARPDEAWEVKAVALKALTRRGRTGAVTALLEDVATATGTRLDLTLDMLAASGDDRAVPVFLERFRKAPPGEGRRFLQAMSFSGATSALDALFGLFVGPELPVTDVDRRSGALTTRNYTPTLMLNIRGGEARMADHWTRIPADDLPRRGLYLTAMAGVAADRNEEAVKEQLYGIVRQVLFDRGEPGQLRVLALNLLTRKALTLDEAMQLKAGMAAEEPPMRALINDFLWEYF